MTKPGKEKLIFPLLLGLMIILLLSAAVYGYNKGNAADEPAIAGGEYDNTQEADNFNKMLAMVATLEEKVKEAPADIEQRVVLANAYYDLGVLARDAAPDQAGKYFSLAVDNYTEVSKKKTDVNVLVDMATAAFYGGDDKTAEETFNKAIEADPDFYQAHYNYGIYLFHAKGDYEACINEWQKALELKPDGPEAERLERLISGLKSEMAEPDFQSEPKEGEGEIKS